MFIMWDVPELGYFGMWNVQDVGCSRCEICRRWDVPDVECLQCVMFRKWDVRDMGGLGCGMFGM